MNDDDIPGTRPGPAFSNSSMWEHWAARWCDRCMRDAPFRNGISATGCPLILTALSGVVIPNEWWTPGPEEETLGDYRCIEFKGPGERGGEPRPKPEPPKMDGLFERPARRVRMLLRNSDAEVTV